MLSAQTLLLLLLCLSGSLEGLRDYPDQGRDPHIPDYAPHYYYTSLKEKMMESLSVSNCTILSRDFTPDGHYSPPEGSDADIFVTVVPPRPTVRRRWEAIIASQTQSSNHSLSHGANKSFRQFVQITQNLCQSELFSRFKVPTPSLPSLPTSQHHVSRPPSYIDALPRPATTPAPRAA